MHPRVVLASQSPRRRELLALIGITHEVQPADIDPVDIGIQLGATWVPPKVVDSFVGHLLGDVHRSINYQPALGKWIVKIQPSRDLTTRPS